jgi:NAD+ diphosphatase
MKYCPLCASELVRKLVDSVDRLVCGAAGCSFVHWNNPIPVVAALVESARGFVLARNAKWPAGMFSMITGFLERGETPEEAVTRETREELGLEARGLAFIGHYSFIDGNQLLLAFLVRAEGTARPGHEIAELALLSREELGRHDFGRLELTRRIVADGLRMHAEPSKES